MILTPRALFTLMLTGLLGLTAPVRAAEKVRRNVEIEWEAADGASLYEVRIKRKDLSDAKFLNFKLQEPKWSAHVAPGLYRMQIRAYDDREVPGEWGAATDLEVKLPAIIVRSPAPDGILNARGERTEAVNFEWEVIPGASKYHLHVDTPTGAKDEDVREPHARVDLPVAEVLHWNVQAFDDKGQGGEISARPYALTLLGPKLSRPVIEKPLSKYVRELTWNGSELTDHYRAELKVYNPKTHAWDTVETHENLKDRNLPIDVQKPTGRYRLTVQAFAERRASSPPQTLEFRRRGGFQDEAEFERERLRDSVVKPTNFYAIGSYLITKISYDSSNHDTNTRTTFDAVGGTGRIGAGYQNPESAWGAFGIIDMSGFSIGGQTFQFASVELHATRKLELGQKGLFLLGAGVFSKELPVVNGDPQDGFAGVGKVRGMGPHLGAMYWQPLSERFGVQANARAYMSMAGSTSSGQKVDPSLSYQMGLLGSYRVGPAWMSYLGYVYRLDSAVFEASQDSSGYALPGDKNTVNVQGNYVNMMLEYSF